MPIPVVLAVIEGIIALLAVVAVVVEVGTEFKAFKHLFDTGDWSQLAQLLGPRQAQMAYEKEATKSFSEFGLDLVELGINLVGKEEESGER